MERNKRQVGLIQISFQKLEELLHLREGHIITDVIVSEKERLKDSMLIKITGPKMLYKTEGYELAIVPLSDITESDITEK